MSSREIFNTTKLENCIKSQVITTSTNGTSVNMADADSVTFAFNIGASGDTLSGSLYLTLKLQDSADNSTFADVTDSDSLLIAIAGTKQSGSTVVIDSSSEDEKVIEIAYKIPANKQYIRPVIALTGSHSNGTPASVTAIKGNLKLSPESGKANA